MKPPCGITRPCTSISSITRPVWKRAVRRAARILASAAFVLLMSSLLHADDMKEYIYVDGQGIAVEETSVGAVTAICTYTLSPVSAGFTVSGGSGTITVTTGAGCGWSVSSRPAWVIIPPGGGSGLGNGSISYTVTANTGTARGGGIVVGGQTASITQSASSCQPQCQAVAQSCVSQGASSCQSSCSQSVLAQYPQCYTRPDTCLDILPGPFQACVASCTSQVQATCSSQYNQCVSQCP